MNRHGFTLIELIVVVALVAIVGLIAIPAASDMSDRDAAIEAECVSSLISQAKAKAMGRSTNFTITVNTTEHSFTLAPKSGGTPEDQFVYTLKNGVITYADFGGTKVLEFNASGVPVSGGRIKITYGSYNQRIDVHPTTGYVEFMEDV